MESHSGVEQTITMPLFNTQPGAKMVLPPGYLGSCENLLSSSCEACGGLSQSNGVPKKRRLDSDVDLFSHNELPDRPPVTAPRNFLQIASRGSVYDAEQWEGSNTLYQPVVSDLLVSTRSAEQVTFSAGQHFIADQTGNYNSTVTGQVINIWRYSENEGKLYISRSFLFTDRQAFEDVRQQLLQM